MMKKSLSLIFASLIVVCGLSAVSFAQQSRKPWHNINQRERRQDKRTYNGIQSGALTPREAQRLENRDDRIERQEARYRKSGNGLSWGERYRLERGLNHESRYIYRQKHDKQTYPKP